MLTKSDYNCFYNDMSLYSKPVQIEAMCQQITFYNKGTSTMVVNQIPFLPGTGIAFDGKERELDTTRYTIRFTGAGVNSAFVIRKCYTDI